MTWQPTPYAVPYVALAILLCLSALYVWRRRRWSWARTGAALLLAVVVWVVAYTLELAGSSLSQKLFWSTLQYVGIAFIPALWLIFALQYTGHGRWLVPWRVALLGIVSLLCLSLILTNDRHGLMWSRAWVQELPGLAAPYLDLEKSFGAGYYVFLMYALVLGVLATVLLVRLLARSQRSYRWQPLTLMFASGIVLAGGVLEWISTAPPDFLIVGFAVAGLVVAWSLGHLGRADVVSISHNAILQSIDDSVIVLDTRGAIVEVNLAAERLLGCSAVEMVGRSVEQVWPELPVDLADGTGETERVKEVSRRGEDGWHTYDVRVSPVLDRLGEPISHALVLRDVTRRKRAEEDIRHRTAQLEALRDVGLSLAAELDLDDLLRSIVARAVELGEWVAGGLYLYRPQQDVIEWAVAVGSMHAPIGAVLRRGEGLSGKVWETGESLIVDDYPQWDGQAEAYRGNPWAAVVGVPVRWGEEFLGVLDVHADTVHAFSPADAELLELFATQAAIAIQNARLFCREREQRALAEALGEAAVAVGSTLDLDTVLDRILEQVARVVPGDAFSIMLLENGQARTVRRRGYEHLGAAGERPSLAFPVARFPNLEKMCQVGTPVIVLDTTSDVDWIADKDLQWRRSYVAAPVRVGSSTVGFLNVSGTRVGQFGPADAQRLEVFAHYAAQALENARLYQETARRLAQTQVLREMMLAAASSLDFDQVLERAVRTLENLMGVEFLGFALPVEGGVGLRYHPARIGFPPTPDHSLIPLDGSICGRVFQTGEPMIVGDTSQSPYYMEGVPGIRSELGVPVRAVGRVIGVLNLESAHPNRFDEDDLAFYTTVAGQLGMALENARLYEQVRRHADDLATALEQLQELDRMKGEFVQSVSHELRSPLALVRGYAELLDSEELGDLTPEQRGPVEIIARRSRMLSSLVEDITLLLAVETRALPREPVDLAQLARVTAEDFQLVVDQARLTLIVDIGDGVPRVDGEPIYLRRVLDNLLSNAIKFTPAGGTVRLCARRVGSSAFIEVTDTGVGIPVDKQQRVFERFYQVDGSSRRRYGGVGLGLALVKEIVEAHGGTVGLASEQDRGSTFTVVLPGRET